MSRAKQLAWDDTVLPFQLDKSDIRGRVARLDGVLSGVLRQHNYPPQVEALVAEMTLLTALIGHSIKLRWKLSLQVQSKGAVRRIATDYYGPSKEGEPARIRAYASYDADRLAEGDPFDQIGEGYFAILIDQGKGTQPYQGITPIAGGSLAACAEAYFAQSEQLPSRFSLSFGRSSEPGVAEHWRAGGIMLQHMPKSSLSATSGEATGEDGLLAANDLLKGGDSENWNRANILLDTVEELELIGPTVSPDDVLVRLFHEEIPRVYDAQTLRFGCTCSEERVRQSLSIYSAKDIESMTTPEGRVTADCQFCGAHYDLDPATVGFEAKADDVAQR
ncbi:Hsp33 family molecular chaperone HslO [Rhodobacteraceae bacterium]|nr:Hsp33 family molecular chaperone HslO [Paracoccaceae bacterium]